MPEDTAAPPAGLALTTDTPPEAPELAHPRTQLRTALLACAFDSQLKWALIIGKALEARGVECRVVVPSDIRTAISAEQLRDLGAQQVERVPWAEMVRRALDVDVVVLSLAGPSVSRFSHEMHDWAASTGKRPPITISGWVGVIIEKITAGYLARCGTDVVAVNSSTDLRTFQGVADGLGLPTDNLILSGLPLLTGERPKEPTGAPIKTVLFADQPTVPSARQDRMYVYQHLIDYARKHPERTVLLKPRHRLGEDTFHQMRFHPETLLTGVPAPPNFRIDYTPISQTLPTLDLMLTVSSTAALEAVGQGVRTALVSDLDVREQLGNHIFITSGLLRTFDQIERDEIGTPTQSWLDDYFFDNVRTPAEQIAARAADLAQDPGYDRGPSTWRTPFFAAQHQLFAYRRSEAAKVHFQPRRWASRARPVAEWLLPYGVVRRLQRNSRRGLGAPPG